MLYTCLVFCAVVAVSLRSNYVVEAANVATDDSLDRFLEECTKEYGTTQAEINAATLSGDFSGIKPCFWSCYFKNIGILNDEGQYDLDTGLVFYRNYFKGDAAYAMMESVAKQCESVKDEAVKDGEAGCERGVLVAECFTKITRSLRQK